MTIKLAPHITISQVSNWLKKGCQFEIHGFNGFMIAENATMINLINQANNVNTK